MIAPTELQNLLQNTETYRVERTTSTNVTQGDTLDIWIEDKIRKNSKITTEELAKLSGKGLRTIKRHLAKLPHIKYVGSGYSGHWEIIDNKE